MDYNQIQDILKKHKAYLNRDEDGKRADLSGANLSGADLFGADLSGANLSGAALYRANLSRADLSRADGIISITTYKWTAIIQPELIQIGCQSHKPDEWWSFSNENIARMSDGALAWWQIFKPIIQAAHTTLISQVKTVED